jgi:thiamine biosynthesis lipoprotein
MRFVERLAVAGIAVASLGAEGPRALSPESRAPSAEFVHGQRYAMGTMFDLAVYHPARAPAERAIEAALAEIVRLDHVLSHYDADSDLSRLVRSSLGRIVTVDPALYDVLGQALEISRRSGGSFDVTIGPLVRLWEAAQASGEVPSAEAIAKAKRCVGYTKVKLVGADRVQLDSACVSIDLGGIGKGYAVERAMRILEGAGIAHAVINAGQSSIAAIGHPPDRAGWLVTGFPDENRPRPSGPDGSGPGEIELRDSSLSISRQARVPLGGGERDYGGIIDPAGGRPVESSATVVVRAASAAEADALSTTLLLLSIGEGKRLLEGFPRASALWISADGNVLARHRDVVAARVKR